MTDLSNFWTQEQAIELCRKIEAVAPLASCHVALTGGCLYKDGIRKDVDIMFYRVRQVEKIDADLLWKLLRELGIDLMSHHGWVRKAEYDGKAIDFFFPESQHVSDAVEYDIEDF